MTPHSQLAGQQLSEKDLLNIMEELDDVRAKWYNIGLGLGLSVGTLDALVAQYRDSKNFSHKTEMASNNHFLPNNML